MQQMWLAALGFLILAVIVPRLLGPRAALVAHVDDRPPDRHPVAAVIERGVRAAHGNDTSAMAIPPMSTTPNNSPMTIPARIGSGLVGGALLHCHALTAAD